ncbi:unnamed protein product [Symbiodinium natans]|uniref:Protein SYM1 n=1 Tax=Symbiodinium natans TaxID=878477 RepID=A0A812I9M3_9DINO|nr:unnamed protein product [Symbiodinium natans]
MLRAAHRFPARVGRCDRAQTWQQRGRRTYQASRPRLDAKGDGISHDIQYDGLWGAITTFPKRQPFATNVIVATVKTSVADLIVQKAEGKEKVDWQRNGAFTAFGFAYLGIIQWFIYVTLFTRLCPHAIRFANLPFAEKLKDRAGQMDLVKQTCLDNFVHYTFVYFPVFYVIKEGINTVTASSQAPAPAEPLVSRALAKYWRNAVQDNLYMWALWVPFDLIIYAVPIWMRLPLNHSVSLAWTMILSALRGSEK